MLIQIQVVASKEVKYTVETDMPEPRLSEVELVIEKLRKKKNLPANIRSHPK